MPSEGKTTPVTSKTEPWAGYDEAMEIGRRIGRGEHVEPDQVLFFNSNAPFHAVIDMTRLAREKAMRESAEARRGRLQLRARGRRAASEKPRRA